VARIASFQSAALFLATTVDGTFFSQFGSGSVMYVTLPSRNLGKLKSFQLFSNGPNGNVIRVHCV